MDIHGLATKGYIYQRTNLPKAAMELPIKKVSITCIYQQTP